MTVPFSVLLCKLKSCVTKIRLNPAKRNLFRSRSDILPGPCVVGYRPRPSCDGFESRAIGPSGGKTPPPYRGGGPKGRRGFPCTRVTFPFLRPVYVVRGCVRRCSRGREPPPPLRGSSPYEAGEFWRPHGEKRVVTTPAAWRTEGALRHAQSLLNPHSISTAPKKALAGPKDSEIRVSGCAKFQIQRNKEHGPFSDCYHLAQNKKGMHNASPSIPIGIPPGNLLPAPVKRHPADGSSPSRGTPPWA